MDEHTQLLQDMGSAAMSYSTPALPTGMGLQTLILGILSQKHTPRNIFFLESCSVFPKEMGKKPRLSETAEEPTNPQNSKKEKLCASSTFAAQHYQLPKENERVTPLNECFIWQQMLTYCDNTD